MEAVEEGLDGRRRLSLDGISQLVETGMTLPPYHVVERAMGELQGLLQAGQQHEERARLALNARSVGRLGGRMGEGANWCSTGPVGGERGGGGLVLNARSVGRVGGREEGDGLVKTPVCELSLKPKLPNSSVHFYVSFGKQLCNQPKRVFHFTGSYFINNSKLAPVPPVRPVQGLAL